MTIVVPAERISELLELPYFEEIRMKHEEEDSLDKEKSDKIARLESDHSHDDSSSITGDEILENMLKTSPKTHEEMKKQDK